MIAMLRFHALGGGAIMQPNVNKTMMNTISQLTADFTAHSGHVSALAKQQLAIARDPNGEGARVFLSLNDQAVIRDAALSDQRFARGEARALEGITISIKDLFDVAGEVTSAGSTVLRTRAPASADAPAIARLRNAGAIPFGRTNMTEFAFSGVGINPHYGTPRNVWARKTDGSGRIPGGSSSGAGVSVADGMCTAALGTDTGGSVRIPAALNGVVGFKPSAYRVPVLGSVPLSVTQDSIGPLAHSVDDCARIDAVLSGETYLMQSIDLRGIKLLKPLSIIWNDLDPEVELATLTAIERLKEAGATIVEVPLTPLDEALKMTNLGVSSLALDWHDEHIGLNGVGYDPRVWKRMQLGRDVTRQRQSDGMAKRRFWIDRMNILMSEYDAVLCPTAACIAPEIAPLVDDEEKFFAANVRILRNTAWVNALDGCAITIPCHGAGNAPVGLQIAGRHGTDHHVLAVGRACEAALR
jgi:aspartyl-tRNA(Asn)/glutamyl-tRNA(Gln) amidotransferase subunit A